ncbi:hypothetical protein PJ985_20220 [Streptomyces sp. ACA25]|uniref:hypothetical protein n=1 Tax=Streptomyces sp. ACA25 TaxID=3022596 RepID=UPI002307F6CA|nr:hypothetical protein [Streptomyces sp. ACA25]MDB1089887.1 hypothetical protein [Streptomyces sp. ACA25]
MPVASLEGRTFAPVADQQAGQVGTRTRFRYHQHGHQVWADYSGGDIVRGALIGTRSEDMIDFRYVQLRTDGTTASGHCVSRIVALPGGRLRLEESWRWESQPGRGTSIVEETGDGPEAPLPG